MAAGAWKPDLFGAVSAAADGIARTLRRDPASAVLFWGDPPDLEVVHKAGVPDEVCRSLSGAGGSYLSDAVRRGGQPLRVQTESLPPEANGLGAALRAHDIPGVALFPLNGERGPVGCMVVPLERQVEAISSRPGWELACRSLAGLQAVAGAAALRVVLREDRRRPLGLCDGVVVVDRWGRVLLAHGVVREVAGWNRADPFGRALPHLPGGELLADVVPTQPGQLQWHEHVLPSIEGQGIPMAVAALPAELLEGEAEEARVILVRDLRPGRPERPDSTARVLALALRVAHASDEFVRHHAEGADSPELLETFVDIARQVPGIVREALDRSVDEGHQDEVDLNVALGGILDGFRSELEIERVRVFSFLRPELESVPGDALELHRALRLLVGKARESLRCSGGTLTVRTWAEDGWACTAVSEDGAGESPADTATRFAPLFTDPPGERDSQLEDVRSMAKAHGGRFQVERRPKVWTRYTLMLPVERREVRMTKVALPTEATVSKDDEGNLQVLIVDDNAALRSVLRRYLERRGHAVTEAVDGDEALEMVSGRDFDRVIVDIQMPGKSGPEFFTCLADVAPAMQTRTLFMTGGFLEEATEQFIEDSGRPSIKKPFDLTELARTVEGAA